MRFCLEVSFLFRIPKTTCRTRAPGGDFSKFVRRAKICGRQYGGLGPFFFFSSSCKKKIVTFSLHKKSYNSDRIYSCVLDAFVERNSKMNVLLSLCMLLARTLYQHHPCQPNASGQPFCLNLSLHLCLPVQPRFRVIAVFQPRS